MMELKTMNNDKSIKNAVNIFLKKYAMIFFLSDITSLDVVAIVMENKWYTECWYPPNFVKTIFFSALASI